MLFDWLTEPSEVGYLGDWFAPRLSPFGYPARAGSGAQIILNFAFVDSLATVRSRKIFTALHHHFP